jgi:hypothetical protein
VPSAGAFSLRDVALGCLKARRMRTGLLAAALMTVALTSTALAGPGNITVINEAGRCVFVKATSQDLSGRTHQWGQAWIDARQRKTFNVGGAPRADIRVEVKQSEQCSSPTIASIQPYRTDVSNDVLAVRWTGQWQVVRVR